MSKKDITSWSQYQSKEENINMRRLNIYTSVWFTSTSKYSGLDGKQLMTKHCKFPADQNWQCQKPSHRFLRFPITHWSTHKPHNSNAHILQITCFFLGLWNENKVSQTKILQDYIKYRQKYRPVPPLGLLVDPPMVSISKFHVTSFSGYHIYKIFRKPDLWRWPWGWVH